MSLRDDISRLLTTPEERVEGRLKVTGKASYAADLLLDGALWCEYVRSPLPHAVIGRVDTAAALALPGVHAVLTGADLPPCARFGRRLMDWPVLARDRVRFIGDRVAAIAAETREAAAEAAQLVEVQYEELPAVFTPEAALAGGAPILHERPEEYVYLGKRRPPVPHPNAQGHRLIEVGSAEERTAAFHNAYRVFEHVFTTPRQHQGYMEPHACVVWIDPPEAGGLVHVRSTNKAPFALRRQMSRTIDVPEAQIAVDSSFIGGDFGGKGTSLDEYTCYFLARATGRPVRAVMTYTDELGAASPRHPTVLRLRTALDEQGHFLAHESDVLFDGGAYAGGKPSEYGAPRGGADTLGAYRVPLTSLRITAAYTNNVPSGNMRAPGEMQAVFAAESHVDMIATDLGIDPIELRLRNALQDGERSPQGERIRSPRVADVLHVIQQDACWKQPSGRGRGRGVAVACRYIDGGSTSLILRLLPDTGQIEVLTGLADQGAGAHTMIRRVVAAAMSVAPERVLVRYGATNLAPEDPGPGGSRVTYVVGRAALDGAERLKSILQLLAAETYGWPTDQVSLEDDSFVAGLETVDFSSAAERIGRGAPVEVRGAYDSAQGGDDLLETNTLAYAVEVEVDRETGEVRVLDTLMAAAVGAIINPTAHQGQLDGGFAFGIGAALMEDLSAESGKIRSLSLGDYKLPAQPDMPPFRTVLVRSDEGPGPFGAQGAGELTNIAVAPAIANAVAAAVGVRVVDLPIISERVLALLRARQPTPAR